LLAFAPKEKINSIDEVISIYKNRLECLKEKEAKECIEKFPLDRQNDALDKTFSMSFPKAYYKAKLKRDLKLLEKQKLCYGRALSESEAKECLKSLF
jgi:hypothetical protein